MSSGDAGDITPLLTGGLSVHLPLNFARYDALSTLVQPRDLVGSPVQLYHFEEEHTLQARARGAGRAAVLASQRLGHCYTGGGFPDPLTARLLVGAGHCPEGVQEVWGSYESWDIGAGTPGVHNAYTLVAANVLDWQLRSFGPYRADQGEGELLLRTRAQNRHAEPAFDAERLVSVGGQRFFRTRDIVRAAHGQLSMIDKTTVVFEVGAEQALLVRWVRAGVVEAALEARRDVVRCAQPGVRVRH
jgi:hypothetical protein